MDGYVFDVARATVVKKKKITKKIISQPLALTLISLHIRSIQIPFGVLNVIRRFRLIATRKCKDVLTSLKSNAMSTCLTAL